MWCITDNEHYFFDCCDNVEDQNFDAQSSKLREKILEDIWLNNDECEKIESEDERRESWQNKFDMIRDRDRDRESWQNKNELSEKWDEWKMRRIETKNHERIKAMWSYERRIWRRKETKRWRNDVILRAKKMKLKMTKKRKNSRKKLI